MACMKLGSRSELFHRDGHTWFCSFRTESDIVVEVGESSFHLHKFPLLDRSKVLDDLIAEAEKSSENGTSCVVQLDDLPGGTNSFLLVAKFCYGVRIELDALNIVRLRCAAEYLGMTEEKGEGNLIEQTENFLNEVFSHWTDSLQALETCEEVLPLAEELHIVSRCIRSLAMKACAEPSLFSWPMSVDVHSPDGNNSTVCWNGIWTSASAAAKPHRLSGGDDWWYEDVSFLTLPLYKRLIQEVISNGMKPERVAGALMSYARRYLPLLGRQSSFQNVKQDALGSTIKTTPQADQRNLLEEIVELLPDQKGIAPTKFLLRLLRTAILLHASTSCQDNLEKRIGSQLDQAALEDLLIPNVGYSAETLYDIDCVQRMLDHFMFVDRDEDVPTLDDYMLNDQGTCRSLTPVTLVANLIDNFLAEVAPDVNFKLTKFQSLAILIPDYARPIDDGIYRAIDIYLKAHPWLTDSEREQLCRLMNCQKLSLEASTHAAQNERLPLRVIVQVLYFEQLRLRTSVAGWFYVSENLDNSHNHHLALVRNTDEEGVDEDGIVLHEQSNVDAEMRERVMELEKECMSMKQEIEKLIGTKNKGSWNMLLRKLGFGKTVKQNGGGAVTTKTADDHKVMKPEAGRNDGKESPIPKSTTPLVMNGTGGDGDDRHQDDESGN
ncbi:BTB/POZ domain-containing protein At5g03250 [Linum grandiflorum]